MRRRPLAAGGWLARGLLLASLLFLAACATQAPRTETAPRPMPEAIRDFSLEGRLAMRRAGDNFSGRFSWDHRGGRDEILLSNPLGQGVASLVGDDHTATLELADHRRFDAPDVDSLSEKIFGARLPLRNLPAWILGRPGQGGHVELDDHKRPSRLYDEGWQIDFLAFESDDANALPTRLLLQRGDLEVRLAIDTWTLDK